MTSRRSKARARADVLVLTRDGEVVRVVKRIVSGARPGRGVRGMASGTEAMDLIRTSRPALLLVDDGANDMPVLELLKAIRDFDDRLPIVFIARDHDAETERDVRQRGVLAYVDHPIDETRLGQILTALLPPKEGFDAQP